jgi:acetoin utilization deacetylase AcuC-like enzyme
MENRYEVPIGDCENTLSFPGEETSLGSGLSSHLPGGDAPCPSSPPHGFLHHTIGTHKNGIDFLLSRFWNASGKKEKVVSFCFFWYLLSFMGRLKSLLPFLRKWKFPFKFVYSEDYWMIDLNNHVFPVQKYRLIYEKLLLMGAKKDSFFRPQPASEEDVLLVHSSRYLNKLKSGGLSHKEVLALELPYSPELFDFALLYVGGTISAAELSLLDGLSVHIGGGFHHAFADHGEGFCILNDVAVAVEKLKREEKIRKAMIVDVDVHQGNGTASILEDKDYVYTFSIHQMDLYPAEKANSSLDVGLWSGDGDDTYLSALKTHFPRLYKEFQPDIVLYLAGADPYEKDQLGGLKVTEDGLKQRGKIIIGEARRLKIPVVILLAGGYAYNVKDTVTIHLNTVKMAQKMQRRFS